LAHGDGAGAPVERLPPEGVGVGSVPRSSRGVPAPARSGRGSGTGAPTDIGARADDGAREDLAPCGPGTLSRPIASPRRTPHPAPADTATFAPRPARARSTRAGSGSVSRPCWAWWRGRCCFPPRRRDAHRPAPVLNPNKTDERQPSRSPHGVEKAADFVRQLRGLARQLAGRRQHLIRRNAGLLVHSGHARDVADPSGAVLDHRGRVARRALHLPDRPIPSVVRPASLAASSASRFACPAVPAISPTTALIVKAKTCRHLASASPQPTIPVRRPIVGGREMIHHAGLAVSVATPPPASASCHRTRPGRSTTPPGHSRPEMCRWGRPGSPRSETAENAPSSRWLSV
jgi:hypothetical protein